MFVSLLTDLEMPDPVEPTELCDWDRVNLTGQLNLGRIQFLLKFSEIETEIENE